MMNNLCYSSAAKALSIIGIDGEARAHIHALNFKSNTALVSDLFD